MCKISFATYPFQNNHNTKKEQVCIWKNSLIENLFNILHYSLVYLLFVRYTEEFI